jgi:hypothetical protein
MTTRSFSLALIAATFFFVGCVAAFNWAVDPYWYFRTFDIVGFNHVRLHAEANERLVKPALVTRLQPQTVILGNSVAAIGLPPSNPGFTQNGAMTSYNLALPGGTWNEIYCLALYVMRNSDVRRLLIGVSGMHGGKEENCPPDSAFSRPDYAKLLFSRSALSAARNTLRDQDQTPTMTADGNWYYHRFVTDPKILDRTTGVLARLVGRDLCRDIRVREAAFDRRLVQTAPVPKHVGASLRTLIRTARAKRIELVLLFYPKHVVLNEVQRACQGHESHWSELWEVVSIAEQEGDGKLTQVWDFETYVPMNAERVQHRRPGPDALWQELQHFNQAVGAAALDTIYGRKPGYGDRVTADNFQELMTRREAERVQFLISNPWVREDLEGFARRVATSAP